jgi:hypothetical protein
VEQRFRLNEFKELFNAVKTNVEWVDHLLRSFFYLIEELVINNRVKVELDKAVETVELPPLPDLVSPVYRESPSIARSEQAKASTSLPEMRLTAPWYVGKVSERSEPPEGLQRDP